VGADEPTKPRGKAADVHTTIILSGAGGDQLSPARFHMMDLVLAAAVGFILGWLCFQIDYPLAGYLPY